VKPSQPHPAFRGVMTWSINWDVVDGRSFSEPVGKHLHAANTAN
jgi:chitinase